MRLITPCNTFNRNVLLQFAEFLSFDLIGAYQAVVLKEGLLPSKEAIQILSEADCFSKESAEYHIRAVLKLPHHRSHNR